MNVNDSLSPTTIERWEVAGASLLTAFKDYANFLAILEASSTSDGADPRDFTPLVENILGTVHRDISDQLPKITSTLVKTRNKLLSPIFRFPQEVLLKIFIAVLSDHYGTNNYGGLPIEESLRYIVHHLHTLCQVCTTWRCLMLATGALWSVIPTICQRSGFRTEPYGFILRRAGESPLHLAAAIRWEDQQTETYEALRQYGSRLHTVNLYVHDSSHPSTIAEAITLLLNHGVTGTLSELSFRLRGPGTGPRRPWSPGPEPKAEDYVFRRDSDQLAAFTNLLGSLKIFRIHGVNFYWDLLAFSSRLVELRVEYVKLGYDDAVIPFLQALSSASALRDLKVIEVETFHEPSRTPNKNTLPIVALPKLQSFLLQGLYFNTLELLLSAITPSSQCLIISLNSKSIAINEWKEIVWTGNYESDISGVGDGPDTTALWAALGPIQVNTLRIGDQREPWLGGSIFRTILGAMPDLKTLETNGWVFDDESNYTRSLLSPERSYERQSNSQDISFPELETIHFTDVSICNAKAFKEVIDSHPLRRIVIGGRVKVDQSDPGLEGTGSFDPLEKNSDLVQWLRNSVPNVRLVDSGYCPAEFSPGEWQLW